VEIHGDIPYVYLTVLSGLFKSSDGCLGLYLMDIHGILMVISDDW
jgi:hypothetical protein